MRSIFISRPTWVAQEFESGLDKFLVLLESYDLKPRTLGSSDYPTESPLDEVIEIMSECVGAIVLGYPQIEIKNGTLKGNNICDTSPIILPTEWNHIEAGLAYAKGLPLLVIHHKGINRGVFDRGALNKFLHEVNMSSDSWFSDGPIMGALSAWRKRLLEKPLEDKHTSTSKDNLQFDNRSGTFTSQKNNFRYCAKCYRSSPSNIVELQERDNGWKCSVCGEFYSNPNYNPPRTADNDYDPFNF